VKGDLGGAELVASEDAGRALLRVVEPEHAGLYAIDGKPALERPVTAAYVYADGAIGVVGWTADKGYELSRIGGKVRTPTVPLVDGQAFQIVGEDLIWETSHGPETSRLVSLRIPTGPDASPSMLVLGAVPRSARHEACQAGVTRAMVVAPAVAQTGFEAKVALAPDGRWLPSLLSAKVPGGSEGWRLDCRPAGATLTWLATASDGPPGDRDAHQIRCDRAGCGHMEARLSGLGHGAAPLAVDLQGKLLVVWYHDDESVRMRLGSLVDMARASEVVLLDASRDPSQAIEGLELHTTPDAAIVLAATKRGTLAIRIDASGAFAPVAVTSD